MHQIYEMAFQLLKTGDERSVEKGFALLRQEVMSRPSDMKALFEYAGAFDFVGKEEEALPHYEKVLQTGVERLPAEDQPRLFVQLGSTLRNLNRLAESQEVLRKGLALFPQFQALKAFLALTAYSSGDQAMAVQLLFELLLSDPLDPSIRSYSRALGWYAERVATFPDITRKTDF